MESKEKVNGQEVLAGRPIIESSKGVILRVWVLLQNRPLQHKNDWQNQCLLEAVRRCWCVCESGTSDVCIVKYMGRAKSVRTELQIVMDLVTLQCMLN